MVTDVVLDELAKAKIAATNAELVGEREMVKELLAAST